MVFSEQLTKARQAAGMTQAELGAAVGAAQSTISQLEAGARKPSYDMLEILSRALGLSIAYFVGESVEGLTEGEEEHFLEYRSLTDEARAELREYTSFLQRKYRSRGRSGD